MALQLEPFGHLPDELLLPIITNMNSNAHSFM